MFNWKWPQIMFAGSLLTEVLFALLGDKLVYATEMEYKLDVLSGALLTLFLTYAGGFWKTK